MPVVLEEKHLSKFIKPCELEFMDPFVKEAHKILHTNQDSLDDFKGFLNWPSNLETQEIKKIEEVALQIKEFVDVFIVIGIGGSYIGAKAALQFLQSSYRNGLKEFTPKVYFAGNNITSKDLNNLSKICEGKSVAINVVSKSGTTLEPALGFRYFKKLLEDKYGEEGAKKRIFCTTDGKKGALKKFADAKGYTTFVVPDNIGGRYSVLTPVGLLPMAVAGVDIKNVIKGALDAQKALMEENLFKNDCYKYAALRNILYRKDKCIEILAGYEADLTSFGEWYKQLFGESEGKDGKGIFPAYVNFSRDLHSLGQIIQDGKRNIFETVLFVEDSGIDVKIDKAEGNFDNLEFLDGKSINFVQTKALEGTILAHTEGGVPNILLKIESFSEFELGYLFYFFEKACAISATLLGVQPFNQPGVEDYKKNMMSLMK